MDLKTELDKLAKVLVDQTAQKDTPFTDILNAFKELRAYYAMELKRNPPSDDDEPGGFSFDNGVGEGNGGIQRRRSS